MGNQILEDSFKRVDYSNIDLIVEEIITKAISYMPKVSEEEIRNDITKAYLYSRDAHEGQFRQSGDPYIIHPVKATRELLILNPDIVTIQACLLHDVPEDTTKTVEDIEEVFGAEVAYITSGMEKLSKLKYKGEQRGIASLRKMFIAMSEDIRVIFVKLADRIHNMKTLEFHPNPEKRKRISEETLNIYAPIADRLGIFDFKESLENLCFKNLYPIEFNKIQSELDAIKGEQNIFSKNVKDYIFKIVPDNIPLIDISCRIKSPYSIYKKMKRKGYSRVEDLHDLFALRIITNSIPNCYEILGELHNKWSPIPKRFKDYIALPKENGYQSLHTTVTGVLRELGSARTHPTEIQIRTQEMHLKAEIGVAAHFAYSESGKSKIAKDAYWVSEIKNIVDSSLDQEDSEFMSNMKLGIFDDRIFVFSPKGDVINLPKGSTPVDFAYYIHSELGNHIAIAKVNGKVVPLDYELNNGESVEIIVDKKRNPLLTWLSFIKTAKARDFIKSYINKTNREELIERGKFILNTYLQKNFGIGLDKDVTILKNIDGNILDTRGKEDILVQIGNLSRKPGNIISKLLENSNFTALNKLKLIKKEEDNQDNKREITKSRDDITDNIIIGGQKNIPYKLSSCCEPKKGNKIVGYMTRNGVSIHKLNCPSLKKLSFDRFIQANYEGTEEKQEVSLIVEMIFKNKIGVLKKITDIFFHMGINIEEIHTAKDSDGNIKITLNLITNNEDYYIFDRLIDKIKLIITDEFIDAKLLEIK
ncbi:RelA/SpoT family protein [Candidatus Gracilibacteria bacterium]|nr:RelA/SpoT family protein [Candidatus Gracilibacteria bacterium]